MRDENYIGIALEEARAAGSAGNLPIGAVLLIGDELVGKGRNNQVNNSNYFSHAELTLIGDNASEIKLAHKVGKKIELFTTLEPCFMCFGTSVQNRVNRIVYACPDPIAGATHIKPPTLWYAKRWPEIVRGVRQEEAYDLFISYMRENAEVWGNCLPHYEEMRRNW